LVTIRIDALTIEEYIIEKIARKHGVTFDEVEEACFATERHVRRGRQ